MSNIGHLAEAVPGRFGRGRAYGVASSVALLALACPAATICGDFGPIAAWALTFGPGAIVVSLAARFQNFNDSRQALAFVLLSTALRWGVAGLGAFIVLWIWPSLPRNAFLLWLAGMYLLALTVEVFLTMANSSAQEGLRLMFSTDKSKSSSARLREAGR